MSNIDIIRAWKDEEYRNSLTDEQRSQLPENPAGMVEMSDEEMENVGGALGGSSYRICPTPPIILSKQVVCNSAVDACPTRLCVITKSFEQCGTPPILLTKGGITCV